MQADGRGPRGRPCRGRGRGRRARGSGARRPPCRSARRRPRRGPRGGRAQPSRPSRARSSGGAGERPPGARAGEDAGLEGEARRRAAAPAARTQGDGVAEAEARVRVVGGEAVEHDRGDRGIERRARRAAAPRSAKGSAASAAATRGADGARSRAQRGAARGRRGDGLAAFGHAGEAALAGRRVLLEWRGRRRAGRGSGDGLRHRRAAVPLGHRASGAGDDTGRAA